MHRHDNGHFDLRLLENGTKIISYLLHHAGIHGPVHNVSSHILEDSCPVTDVTIFCQKFTSGIKIIFEIG